MTTVRRGGTFLPHPKVVVSRREEDDMMKVIGTQKCLEEGIGREKRVAKEEEAEEEEVRIPPSNFLFFFLTVDCHLIFVICSICSS